ncbi:nucleotidyltransferase [soil metagenome]
MLFLQTGCWISYLSCMKNVVRTKQQLIDVILSNRVQIMEHGVIKLGIFGSFVRDEAKEDSDVDFFVDIIPEKKNLKNFIGLHSFLKEITGREIDLVTPHSLNKFTGKYILEQVEYVSIAA